MDGREKDPLGWCIGITLGFALLAGWRLGIPSKIYFDEVHYVNAARKLLLLLPANPEHPMLGKEAIAAAIALFGDRPWAWRVPALVMGGVGLFAYGRALWWASGRRFATLAGMALLASDFSWFVMSRIAMLDMVMAGLAMVGLWQVAAMARLPDQAAPARARLRLGLAGACLGLAIAAKWSVVPAVLLVCAGLGLWRVIRARGRWAEAVAMAPAPGVGLIEMAFWLGTLPLALYWLSFWPLFHLKQGAIAPGEIVNWHRYMLQLQASVVQHHPYQSRWWQWLVNWRPIWFLYENVDGAQRGILLLGNPFTMLAGLPALGWCVWAGIRRGRGEALWVVALFAACLGLWMLPGKPVQFYYHYLLPGAFLMAALALMLDAGWRAEGGWRWGALAALGLAFGMFGWFFPILDATALHKGAASFEDWMWLASWR